MKEYSLVLEIANLPIQFYCKRRADSSFLREKYVDFLIRKSDSSRLASRVFFKHQSQKIRIKGKDFYLPDLPLKKKFKLFNDLLRIVLIYLLNRNSGFILHASSLVKDGLAYIFAGKEDAGKSAIRKLFPELVCLGDDSAIVRKINGQFFLFGSPFYQRTNRAYPNIKVPIAGVFALNQAAFNIIKPLSFPENLKAVLANSYLAHLGLARQEKEQLSKTGYDFCLKTKIFSLFFRKDRSFWKLAEKVVAENLLGGDTKRAMKLVSPQVSEKLPQGIIWSPAVVSWQFLGNCLLINEASWNFEFSGRRRVEEIARLMARPALSSSHVKLINEMKQQGGRDIDKPWIVLLEKDHVFTIIDGNHRALAAYQLGEEGKDLNLKLLIGKLPRGKTCPWC